MFDVLENHSAKICAVMVGVTIAGGLILVLGAPTMVAAYVTAQTVELFGVGLTVGAGVGATAAGISCLRRDSANRRTRSLLHDKQEQDKRQSVGVSPEDRRGRGKFNARNVLSLKPNTETDSAETQERISALEAENRSKDMRLDRLERKLNIAIRGMAEREVDEENASYRAANYSDSASTVEETKQPQLSRQNMFQRAPLEVAANDPGQRDGMVHRRRLGASGLYE